MSKGRERIRDSALRYKQSLGQNFLYDEALLAELTVPVVQFIVLRRELPYRKFIGYVGVYAVIGGIMLICVRLVASLLQAETWVNLGVMTLTGIAVYGALTLAWWKIQGRSLRGILGGRDR